MKYLIINADDFGYSKVFNEKILELIEKDFVLSTSVMVDWIDDGQKEQVARLIELSKTGNLSIGLHVYFKSTDFKSELERQSKMFAEIFGFKPAHIDLHKREYAQDGYPFVVEFSRANNIPCKNIGVAPYTNLMTENKTFNGTNKSFLDIEKLVGTFEDGKFYSILFHPGEFDPENKTSLNKERETDFQNIILLNGILEKYNVRLASYFDFMKSLNMKYKSK